MPPECALHQMLCNNGTLLSQATQPQATLYTQSWLRSDPTDGPFFTSCLQLSWLSWAERAVLSRVSLRRSFMLRPQERQCRSPAADWSTRTERASLKRRSGICAQERPYHVTLLEATDTSCLHQKHHSTIDFLHIEPRQRDSKSLPIQQPRVSRYLSNKALLLQPSRKASNHAQWAAGRRSKPRTRRSTRDNITGRATSQLEGPTMEVHQTLALDVKGEVAGESFERTRKRNMSIADLLIARTLR